MEAKRSKILDLFRAKKSAGEIFENSSERERG